MNRNKKAFILLSTYLVILFAPKNNKPQYSINDNYEYHSKKEFASYSNGKVYISNDSIIKRLYDYESNNIYIIDQRGISNPNMEICYSHNINTLKEKKEIISILLEYEKKYPSNWDRTYNSMLNEWIIHNICYKLGIKIDHSISVDLDNADENTYKLIKKS